MDSQVSWVLETPGGTDANSKSLYNETGARRRRAHQKSRKGCANCKQRRVKCDEVRPNCGQCVERKWACEFPKPRTAESGSRKAKVAVTPPSICSEESLTPPTSVSDDPGSPARSSREWVHTQVLAFLERTNVPSWGLGENAAYQRYDAVELVDHFLDYKELWIGSTVSQGIIQKHGFAMAFDASYLLHAMLVWRHPLFDFICLC
jgi:hypothetical protein